MKITPVINEAVRLLRISDKPGLYKSIRRWAREHIKHQSVAPIDTISWPKGCLMNGLLHQAERFMEADNSYERALAIMSVAEVKDYIDAWIKDGANIWTVDDTLAGNALLGLADLYALGKMTEDEDADFGAHHSLGYKDYKKCAEKMMNFLYAHDKDSEGALPYRPAHKSGQIFADGVGMVLPFAIHFGIMNGDDDAVELGMTQIRCFMKHAKDPETGLLWHAYSLGENVQSFGALGWGRAVGWIMYGIGESIRLFEKFGYYGEKKECVLSFSQIKAYHELKQYRDEMKDTLDKYAREDKMFGSIIGDETSPVDTSASAMIFYAICESTDVSALFDKYIDDDGRVLNAQGECMGLGLYSENFASYPWSVGTALLFDI